MRRLRTPLVALLCVAVGGTFIAAGALKSLDVEGFARDIALHGIVGDGISSILARLLIPVEIVLGAAAIIGARRRAALVLLIAALVGFIGATAWAWSQGNTQGCGCFGRYASRTPLSVIVEDLVLIGAAALAPGLRRPPAGGEDPRAATPSGPDDGPASAGASGAGGWKAWVLAPLAVLASAFALASPYLPIDSIATALRPGVRLSDLGLDQIAGNLAEGDRLLTVLVLDEAASQNAVSALNALSAVPGLPRPIGLTSSGEEKRAEFFFAHAPGFDLLEVPAADLRRLYRRAPRTFQVHNGEVLRVWDGVPPVEDLAP